MPGAAAPAELVADQDIVSRATVQIVVARTTDQCVVARTATQDIVALAADHEVVASTAGEVIVERDITRARPAARTAMMVAAA